MDQHELKRKYNILKFHRQIKLQLQIVKRHGNFAKTIVFFFFILLLFSSFVSQLNWKRGTKLLHNSKKENLNDCEKLKKKNCVISKLSEMFVKVFTSYPLHIVYPQYMGLCGGSLPSNKRGSREREANHSNPPRAAIVCWCT